VAINGGSSCHNLHFGAQHPRVILVDSISRGTMMRSSIKDDERVWFGTLLLYIGYNDLFQVLTFEPTNR
jgi:hypothetical protein